jgi:hypothetical protein
VDKKILVTFQLGPEFLRAVLCDNNDLRLALFDTFLRVVLTKDDISGFYSSA